MALARLAAPMGWLGFGKKTKHKDPVCGMEVVEGAAGGSESHEGATFWFCSASCRERFRKDPQRYGH